MSASGPGQASAGGASGPVPASAGESGPDADSTHESALEEIVVTGTNIHGAGPGVAQVIALDRADIERSGAGTTADALALLPQNFGGGPSPTNFLAPTPGTSLNLSSGSGVDLRGLGPGATLTLVNGMRVAPSGFGSFVDVSNIPLTAIQRIEVLPDGASAIYGSDAVAGVVNIILRDDYDGAESRVRYGAVSEGSLYDIRASQTFGTTWDRGNALLSYEYQDSSALNAADRSFSGAAELPGEIVPAARRNSIVLSAKEHITDNLEAFGDTVLSQRSNAHYSTYFGGEAAFQDSHADTYTASGGLRLTTARDWDLQLDGSWAKSKEDETQGLLGTPTSGAPTLATQDDLGSLEARADGPILTLPAGSARAALGAAYRNERFAGSTESGTGNVDTSRHVRAGFAEVLVPVVGEANKIPAVRSLEVSAALRYEDYSDVGSTTNPKLALLWRPIADLKVRASWGRSFNAPRLEQTSPYNNFGDVATLGQFGGPFPPPFTDPSVFVLTDSTTNPKLGPERSKNWTAGLEFSPAAIPHFTANVSYFNYDYTNRISYVAQSPLSFVQDPSAYVDYTIFNPGAARVQSLVSSYLPGSFVNFTGMPFNPATTPVFAIFEVGTTNLAAMEESGLDISASYDRPAFGGQLAAGVSAQRLLKLTDEVGTTRTSVDLLNTIYYPADLKLRGTVAWARGGLDLAAAVNFTSSYLDNVDTPQAAVASWTTIDARVAWKFAKGGGLSPLGGITLSLSVQNALNRQPPQVSTANPLNSLGYDPTNANPLGRFVAAEIQKAW
jgi:outer membrane receptor protein involved in Fe transport